MKASAKCWRAPSVDTFKRKFIHTCIHLWTAPYKTAGSVHAASLGQTVNYTCVVDAMFDSLCLTHFLSSGGCAFVLIVAPAHWMYPQSQGGRFRGGFNWNSSVPATFPSAHVHRLPWSSFFPLVHLNRLPGPAKQICHNTVI